MKIIKNVPLVTTSKLAELKEFYTKYFGFKVIFEHEMYLGLGSSDGSSELGFMPPSDNNPNEYSGSGVTFCLMVDDVDAEYERLKSEGLEPFEPADNPWGDRSFILADPIGIGLYIYKETTPTGDFADAVKE